MNLTKRDVEMLSVILNMYDDRFTAITEHYGLEYQELKKKLNRRRRWDETRE